MQEFDVISGFKITKYNLSKKCSLEQISPLIASLTR